MSFNEEYIFWQLAHFYVTKQGYRILNLSKDQTDIWLEKLENKERPIIRLKKADLPWSNLLKRDRDITVINGERIRKRFLKKNLKITNLYISKYPPIDSYEHLLQPVTDQKKRVEIQSQLLTEEYFEEYYQNNFENTFFIHDEMDEKIINYLKNETLHYAIEEMKKEKQLFDHSKPIFTYVFIVILLIMFMLLEINGGSTNEKTLTDFGAKVNPLIVNGEWWRFFTPIFLHIGMIHLVMNTIALYFLGTAVEKIYGKLRFIFIFILSGFSGSLASFLFSPNLSAGASGAIFGCFGALLYFGVIHPRLFARTMGANVLIMIGINLAFGFTFPGIDNAGHIGGLIGGFLASGIIHLPKKKNFRLQLIWTAITILIFSISIPYGYANGMKNSDPYLMASLAQHYNQEEEYEKAYSLLDEYIEDYGDGPAEIYFVLSYAEIHLNYLDDAKLHLEKAVQLRSDFHEAYYNLAILYLNEGHLQDAKNAAEKALNIVQNDKYKSLLDEINLTLQSVDEGE